MAVLKYPEGTPSTGFDDSINQSTFSPANITAGIRDNYSAVNNATMRNTHGKHISLLENFVNSTYLGRSTVPVLSGFITNLTSTTIDNSDVIYTKYLGSSSRYVNSIYATTGNITTLNSTTGNITTINSTTGNITTINSTTINNSNYIYSKYIGSTSNFVNTAYITTLNSASNYGTNIYYTNIYASIVDTTTLFANTIGSTSDVVNTGYIKQLYSTIIGSSSNPIISGYITNITSSNIVTNTIGNSSNIVSNIYTSKIGNDSSYIEFDSDNITTTSSNLNLQNSTINIDSNTTTVNIKPSSTVDIYSSNIIINANYGGYLKYRTSTSSSERTYYLRSKSDASNNIVDGLYGYYHNSTSHLTNKSILNTHSLYLYHKSGFNPSKSITISYDDTIIDNDYDISVNGDLTVTSSNLIINGTITSDDTEKITVARTLDLSSAGGYEGITDVSLVTKHIWVENGYSIRYKPLSIHDSTLHTVNFNSSKVEIKSNNRVVLNKCSFSDTNVTESTLDLGLNVELKAYKNDINITATNGDISLTSTNSDISLSAFNVGFYGIISCANNGIITAIFNSVGTSLLMLNSSSGLYELKTLVFDSNGYVHAS